MRSTACGLLVRHTGVFLDGEWLVTADRETLRAPLGTPYAGSQVVT
jgi:hypothetical protein